MAGNIRWSEEEDNILTLAVTAEAHNKNKAIEKVLPKLNNRTKAAAAFRWYYVLSNPEHPKYVGSMFTMVCAATRLDNRTIYRKDSRIIPIENKKNFWYKIKTELEYNWSKLQNFKNKIKNKIW